MKKINIANILKNCPEGTKLYSPLCGECTFVEINAGGTIICRRNNGQDITFTQEGYFIIPVNKDCECMLFPSKENRDWSKFQRPFKPGDVLVSEYGNVVLFSHADKDDIVYYHCLLTPNRFSIELKCGIGKIHNCTLASEEQKQRLFERLKKSGYKYITETNTLERLIVPKFKIGDKITPKDFKGKIRVINAILDNEYNLFGGGKIPFSDQDYWKLVPNKETRIKLNKCTHCVYAVNNNHCGLRGFRSDFNVSYCSAQNTDKLPNGFELQEDGYFSWINKKSKYPITYEDCKILLNLQDSIIECCCGYEWRLISNFQKLLLCRDAYWNIAGEEMGLSKPWEPDFEESDSGYVYCIVNKCNNIGLTCEWLRENHILSFPTAEMRDTFYENFKDLIESCKELL